MCPSHDPGYFHIFPQSPAVGREIKVPDARIADAKTRQSWLEAAQATSPYFQPQETSELQSRHCQPATTTRALDFPTLPTRLL